MMRIFCVLRGRCLLGRRSVTKVYEQVPPLPSLPGDELMGQIDGHVPEERQR